MSKKRIKDAMRKNQNILDGAMAINKSSLEQ